MGSRLSEVIQKAKARNKHSDGIVESPMRKSIESAREMLVLRKTPDDLRKGCHDAMYHHARHAAAADSACYSFADEKSRKKCKDAARRHQFMFMRHALEHARKKDSVHSMKRSMEDAMRFYGDQWDENDHEDHKKRVEHFKGGGDFKAHKDDKFKEDY